MQRIIHSLVGSETPPQLGIVHLYVVTLSNAPETWEFGTNLGMRNMGCEGNNRTVEVTIGWVTLGFHGS